MEAEELFVRCMKRSDGQHIAKKLAKLYVVVHFQQNYKKYVENGDDAIFLELANLFIRCIEADLTKTQGDHAAVLSALFLADDLDII